MKSVQWEPCVQTDGQKWWNQWSCVAILRTPLKSKENETNSLILWENPVRTEGENGSPPQCCQMKKFKTSMQSDFPVPLPLSLRFRHSFLTTQKWKRVLLPKSNHRFFQAQTDISLISHLGIKQMSRREKWTRKRTYELRTGCILWGDKLKWALWKLISLLLGHIFMWLLGLEGDLGFKTGYSLPVLYCRYTRLHLAHSHKIEGNIMVPWTYLVLLPFTLLLFLSESELIYCQALCCLCQIQKKGILLNLVR